MNKHMPLISVVVPVYNLEEYVGECIESILAQSYPHFELLIIDDGSEDKTYSVCREYESADDRIRLFSQANFI